MTRVASIGLHLLGQRRVAVVPLAICVLWLLFPSAVAVSSLRQEPQTLSPIWERPLADVSLVAVSRDGGCVAAISQHITAAAGGGFRAESQDLFVFDREGRQLWELVLLGSVSAGARAVAVVVSPGCSWAAVAEVLPPEEHPGSQEQSTILFVGQRGATCTAKVPGGARWLDMAPAGDAVVVSAKAASGAPNVHVLSASCSVTASFEIPGTEYPPDIRFSEDGSRLVVARMALIGVMTRDLKPVWGVIRGPKPIVRIVNGEFQKPPGPSLIWNAIDPSRDSKWFAGEWSMPHGPQAGSVALLDERGNVVWERQMWEPHSIIAPDGSYVVVQGAARKLREEEEPEEPDVVTSLVDRTGKTLVVARLPKISPPWFVSTDSKLIVFHEYIAGHWWLVVRDRSLNAVSRTRDVPNFGPCHSDSGLIVVGENNTLRAYRLPG